MSRRFEYSEGTSNKFWEVSVDGKQLVVRFGRIGSAGQTKLKSFPDAASAKLAMAKLIGEKTREGYVEGAAKPAAAKPRSRKDELAALDAKLDTTLQPYVRIEAKPRAKLSLTQSKGCDGRPYLPKADPWPKVKSGRALLPVMQIDFADVPALPGFPRKGLLSLWWTEDHQEHALFYYPTIVRDDAKLWSDFSRVPTGGFLYPYMKPVALSFAKHDGCVCWGDFRFAQLVGGKAALDALHDSEHYDALFDHVWKRSGGADTRIGGWSNPQQEDPRVAKKLAAYTAQLLQIQNDNFTHNLFIKPADLKRADFSDVKFYDACD